MKSRTKPTDNVIGLTFGNFLILSDLGMAPNGAERMRKVVAKCICGVIKEYRLSAIKYGHPSSCGCDRKNSKKVIERMTTHGLYYHPLYKQYRGMISRCSTIKTNYYYKYYAQRGVVVCDEWKNNFMSFYNWAINNGWKKGLWLDKDIKAKELGLPATLYSPERCQFVTSKMNANCASNNRILTYNGISKTLAQWANDLNISHDTLWARLNKKWSVEKTLNTALRAYKKRTNQA